MQVRWLDRRRPSAARCCHSSSFGTNHQCCGCPATGTLHMRHHVAKGQLIPPKGSGFCKRRGCTSVTSAGQHGHCSVMKTLSIKMGPRIFNGQMGGGGGTRAPGQTPPYTPWTGTLNPSRDGTGVPRTETSEKAKIVFFRTSTMRDSGKAVICLGFSAKISDCCTGS